MTTRRGFLAALLAAAAAPIVGRLVPIDPIWERTALGIPDQVWTPATFTPVMSCHLTPPHFLESGDLIEISYVADYEKQLYRVTAVLKDGWIEAVPHSGEHPNLHLYSEDSLDGRLEA